MALFADEKDLQLPTHKLTSSVFYLHLTWPMLQSQGSDYVLHPVIRDHVPILLFLTHKVKTVESMPRGVKFTLK